jgi:hypothetical protein
LCLPLGQLRIPGQRLANGVMRQILGCCLPLVQTLCRIGRTASEILRARKPPAVCRSLRLEKKNLIVYTGFSGVIHYLLLHPVVVEHLVICPSAER